MNRIDTTLTRLAQSGKKMLSPYLTAGDPSLAVTLELMHALVEAGADVLEVGIPFSDPMAEGVVIQAAIERALIQGVNCHQIFDTIAAFRKVNTTTPIVLMGYVNPVETYGYEAFAQRAKQVGVDGTILVDLPPEESAVVDTVWKKHGLYSIYLCSPTTSPDRMRLINQYARGYLYYVSLKGVTGSSALDVEDVKIQYQLRKQQTSLPLMVGFGIKTAEMAKAVAAFADGVIVGAALVSAVFDAHQHRRNEALAAAALIAGMRDAMDVIEEK